jgi:hypothetical protein
VLRAAGETEITQENIQDRLELEGDPGFQLLTEEGISAVFLFISYYQNYLYYYIFHLFVFYYFVLLDYSYFCFIHQDDRFPRN